MNFTLDANVEEEAKFLLDIMKKLNFYSSGNEWITEEYFDIYIRLRVLITLRKVSAGESVLDI